MQRLQVELLFDGSHGFQPSRFAREIKPERVLGLTDDDYAALADPEHDWEAWDDVESNALIVEHDNSTEAWGALMVARDADLAGDRNKRDMVLADCADVLTVYTLWCHDGDTFMVPRGMEWSDDHDTYTWPKPERDRVLEWLADEGVVPELECLEEDVPVRGNALASGDSAEDTRTEDDIINALATGNEWAWCVARVSVEYLGHSAVDTLGACSYASREDFIMGDYWPDMRDRVLGELADKILADPEAWAQVEVTP